MVDNDPYWGCWLRDERRKQLQPQAFNKDVNDALDRQIKTHRDLRQKFKPWNQAASDLEEIIKHQIDANRDQEVAFQQRQQAYDQQWGAW